MTKAPCKQSCLELTADGNATSTVSPECTSPCRVGGFPSLQGLHASQPGIRVKSATRTALALSTEVFLETGSKRECKNSLLHPCVLGVWGQHKGFWRYWPLSFKEALKKKIGVKAVKGEEIGIAKGRESGGAAAVPQRTRRWCTAPAHPADRDKPPSAGDSSPTRTAREKYSRFRPPRHASVTRVFWFAFKAGNGNCAKGSKCRGTLHCELLLSCCNNGNKIKVLPNDF